MFAQTTHVVAAPHGFACVVIPATRLYIPTFIEIRSWVSEPQGVKIWPFPLLWLVAFTTACTTVQAVINLLWCAQSCISLLLIYCSFSDICPIKIVIIIVITITIIKTAHNSHINWMKTAKQALCKVDLYKISCMSNCLESANYSLSLYQFIITRLC